MRVKGSAARVLERVMRYVESLGPEEILKQHRAVEGILKAAGGVFRWQAEEPAASESYTANGAVNLRLIRTSPEEMGRMARARRAEVVGKDELGEEEGGMGNGQGT
jgi:hypothetical protein